MTSIGATNRFMYTGEFLWRYLNLQQHFVAATSHKIKSARICQTCCGNKIMLQRPRFAQKFSSRQKAICCCDMLCNLLQQLNARPLHTEWFATMSCCSDSLPRALARTSEKCGSGLWAGFFNRGTMANSFSVNQGWNRENEVPVTKIKWFLV